MRATPLRRMTREIEGAKECFRRILETCSAHLQVGRHAPEPADLNSIVHGVIGNRHVTAAVYAHALPGRDDSPPMPGRSFKKDAARSKELRMPVKTKRVRKSA